MRVCGRLESVTWGKIVPKPLIKHIVIRIHLYQLDLVGISQLLRRQLIPKMGIVKEMVGGA